MGHIQRPPGPRGIPFLGAIPMLQRDGIGYLQQAARDYGDVVYLSSPAQNIYLLNHPDLVREVLVTQQHKFKKSRMLEQARVLLGDGLLTSEGNYHLRQRRLVQPAFHRDRLTGYATTMVDRAFVARERWSDAVVFDMSEDMMRLTLDIVCRTLFSAEVEGEAEEIGAAMAHVFGVFTIMLLPGAQFLQKLPLPPIRRFFAAKARLDATIYRLIAEHRAAGIDKGDLLSMLLMAQDDDASQLSDVQVRDEVLTLFLAGHETTANALTWTWYLLSQNPEAEAKLHTELDSVLAGRTPTLADLERLPYATAVFQEGLRMYPPAWAIGRRTLEQVELGGFTIPQGDVVLLSPYITHRDPRWFPEPESFRPERWLDPAADRPKFSYFPFGGGARVCIGERFAGMEGVLLLSVIAQRWQFSLIPGHPVEKQAQITLRPKHGMRMTAHSRPLL